MKVTIDIDCTPEEARRFMGLPDLTSVHEAYVEKLRLMAGEGLTSETVAEMMKSWAPMGEAGMKLWGDMLGQMSGKR